MSTLRQILGNVINKCDEEDWTKYRALGNPSSDTEGKAAGTTNLDFSSTGRKERAYPKNGVWARAVYETKQSARSSRKPWRSQQMPKWFGLEAFSFGSRPDWLITSVLPPHCGGVDPPQWGWVEMAGQISRGAWPKGRPHFLTSISGGGDTTRPLSRDGSADSFKKATGKSQNT